MRVKRKQLKGSRVRLEVSIGLNNMNAYVYQAGQKFFQNIPKESFQMGNIPIEVGEKDIVMYTETTQEDFNTELMNIALQESYKEVIQQENIFPLENPEIKIIRKPYIGGVRENIKTVREEGLFWFKEYPVKEEKTFSGRGIKYSITVTVPPEVKVPDYKSIVCQVKYTENQVTKEDIEHRKNQYLLSYATYTSKSAPATKGDEVIIDFRVEQERKRYDFRSFMRCLYTFRLERVRDLFDQAKQYSVCLGEGHVVEEFEQHLYGLTAGEEKEFLVTFPMDYPDPRLAGQQTICHVTVKDVRRVDKLEWNDEFVQKITNGELSGVADMEAQITEELTQEKKARAITYHNQQLVNAILKKVSIDLPNIWVESEIDNLISEMEREANEVGDTLIDRLNRQGKTWKRLRKELSDDAQYRLKRKLILQKIADMEQIIVDPNQVRVQVDTILSQYSQSEKQNIDRSQLTERVEEEMREQKTIEWLSSISHGSSNN